MNAVISLVGLCGSGKTEVLKIFSRLGYFTLSVGNVVDEELLRKNIPLTELNRKRMRGELHKLYGKDALVFLLFERIEKQLETNSVVIDGMYSWDEYKSLEGRFSGRLTLVAIHCPKELRRKRLESRNVRPLNFEQMTARDYFELEAMNKGGPIAIADYMIINDGTIDELGKKIDILKNKIGGEN